MSKQTILVTGGAGFIGSHVCDALLDRDEKVICVDNFNDYYSPDQKRKNIAHNLNNPLFALEEADITDQDAITDIFNRHRIDKVIHLAARAGVRPSIEHPLLYEETNVKGTMILLELSRKNKIKNFIFGSSSSVYGRKDKVPFKEDLATDSPVSPYAATKKAGEVLCYTYSYLYDMNITCLRFFTVYGPRGRPDMAPFLFTDKIYRGDDIIVFGDGTSRRDYTFVDDIVSGILSALDKEFRFEIFNLGNSHTVELKKLIGIIEEKLSKKAVKIQKDIPKADVIVTYADISKAEKLLSFSPKTGIDEGMASFINWYLDTLG